MQTKKTIQLENRKARFLYTIIEKVEAGIVLQGSEVKSLRSGKANISDAYITIKNEEAFVINLYIQNYLHAGHFNHNENQSRKLLLKRKEILSLKNNIERKRYTAIVLKLFFNSRGKVKLVIGIGKGKNISDKRESQKQKEAKIEMERALNYRLKEK